MRAGILLHVADGNEVGTAAPRGRPVIARDEADQLLSDLAGESIRLPEGAQVHGSPATCPACRSDAVIWGCDERVMHTRESIHPFVWHDTEWMADSYVCGDCDAGWIEPDEPEVITWVRPYWRIELRT